MNFNGDRLKSARLYRGLTVEELAEKIEVSKQTVSQYENNRIDAPFEKIMILSDVLNFPYIYFTQKEPIAESKCTYFRSLMKTNKKYRVEQVKKMEHLATIYSILKNYVEFPKLNLPENCNDLSPAKAACELRKFWRLGNRPISNLVSLFEKNGIIVTMFPTSTDDIDAFSQFIQSETDNDIYLVALSKNKESAARIHFDLAHELGHILLHEWSEDTEYLTREQFREREKQANEFASEFLLPEESFIKDLRVSTDLSYYVQLKNKWKVSIGAMLYRSCTLGIINQNQYQYILRLMQKRNIRKNEPLDDEMQTAKPSMFKDAVTLLLEENVFTPTEFMNELEISGLAMNYKEVEILLDLPKDTLKPITTETDNNKVVFLKDFLKA